jgi:DNA mismatch endonuclease (patch repair protein)
MSRIRSCDTKPEMLLRSLLHRIGFRFRVHCKELPGRPDIVLPKYHTVIFVHGCFWHQHPGCIEATCPKSNTEYWKTKLEGNVTRDRRNSLALIESGWQVLRFWECELEKDPVQIAIRIAETLRGAPPKSSDYTLPSRTELLRAAEARAGYTTRQVVPRRLSE